MIIIVEKRIKSSQLIQIMANFGVDLLLESQKANIKSNSDVLVIVMHWMLCKNNLRNVGVGDNVSFSYSLRN